MVDAGEELSLLFTIHHPPSTIHHPPSTIHHPPDSHTTAAQIALLSRAKNRASGSCGWVVSSTANASRSGSHQASVPVAPQWPKLRGLSRSPNVEASPGQFNRQPRPHGRQRRSSSGTCAIDSSWLLVI